MGQPDKGFLAHFRPRRIPFPAARISNTWCLGGLSFVAFLTISVTGFLLLFHYQPGSAAYESVARITYELPLGGLIRNLHYWGGLIMVLLVLGHMIRVFLHGAYRPPRELNWLAGVALLTLTVILEFSGYLLIGSQEGIAALTVARTILTSLPLIGDFLAGIAFGPAENGPGLALYVWHCFALPLFLGLLASYHFYRVRKDGVHQPM